VPDCTAASIAECWIGAARGTKDAVFLSLGSGVGLSLRVNGAIIAGAHGMIEGGHMIIKPNGRPCDCGQRGCLEAYCSANAVVAQAREMVGSAASLNVHGGGSSSLVGLAASAQPDADAGGDGGITCAAVFAHAAAGDRAAQAIVRGVAANLATGILNICRVTDPSLVVLSGGMAGAGEQLLELVRAELRQQTWTVLPTHVRVCCAELGAGTSGLVGAAAAARDAACERRARGDNRPAVAGGRSFSFAVGLVAGVALTSVLARLKRT
jgi:glucokinase